MPYICLSRSDISDGTIQVLDLQPNASQVVPATGGYPQTGYVNRALNETLSVDTVGGLGVPHASGLRAYLVDRVEPGGNETASATVTSIGPLHGDIITLPGLVLTATANYAVGTITCNGPTIAGPDTVVLGATTFTCVEDRSVGTVTMVNPVNGDTLVIKGVTFTCVENFGTGLITILGGCTAGDIVAIKGIDFTAGVAEDLPNRVFLDVVTAGSVLASAASLILAINEVTTVQPLFLATVPLLETVAAVAGGVAGEVNLTTGPTRGLVGEVDFTESTGGARITVSGAGTLVAIVPDPTAQEFAGLLQAVGGTNDAVATSLELTINDAVSQALIVAAPAPAGGATCAAVAALAAVALAADATHPGAQGDFGLTETGGHITLSGALMTHVDAVAAVGEFNSLLHFGPAGTDTDVADSLVLAIDASAELADSDHVGALVTVTADNRGLVGELVWTESTAGVRFTISAGGALVCAAIDPTTPAHQFAALAQVAGGTNAAVATSLRTALVHADAIAAMAAATGGPYVTAAAPGAAIVTMTARDAVGAIVGPTGNMLLVSSAVARLVPDATTATTGVLNRTHQFPSATFCAATATAILARMDAGLSMDLAATNTLLQTNFGAELSGVTSNSTGVLADMLSILAGRAYRVNQFTTAGALNQYMNPAAPAYLWAPTARGSFTKAVLVHGATMQRGEIRPAAIGGDTIQREYRPIRSIADTDAFRISLAGGTLAVFADVAGMPPVTLWPDSDRLPYFPWSMQGPLNQHWATVTNARLLTVYDDNGNVLA